MFPPSRLQVRSSIFPSVFFINPRAFLRSQSTVIVTNAQLLIPSCDLDSSPHVFSVGFSRCSVVRFFSHFPISFPDSVSFPSGSMSPRQHSLRVPLSSFIHILTLHLSFIMDQLLHFQHFPGGQDGWIVWIVAKSFSVHA